MLKISMDIICRMTPEHLSSKTYMKFVDQQNSEFQQYRNKKLVPKLEKRYKFLVSYVALNDKCGLFPFHGYATFPNKNITEEQMEECLETFKNRLTGEVKRITLTAISFLGKVKV